MAPWLLVLPRFLLAQVSPFSCCDRNDLDSAGVLPWCLIISLQCWFLRKRLLLLQIDLDGIASKCTTAPQTHICRNDTGGSSWSGWFSTLPVVCWQQSFVPRQTASSWIVQSDSMLLLLRLPEKGCTLVSLPLNQGCVVPLDLAFACCLCPIVFWSNLPNSLPVALHVFHDYSCVRVRIGNGCRDVLATAQTIPLLSVGTTTIVQTVSSNQTQLYKDPSMIKASTHLKKLQRIRLDRRFFSPTMACGQQLLLARQYRFGLKFVETQIYSIWFAEMMAA